MPRRSRRSPKRRSARRASCLSRPEPEPAPEPIAVAAPAPAPPEAQGEDGATGAWNLLVLERLVNDRGAEFPERRDEWISYLYFLREYAEPDGTVPGGFDWLIQDTFAELVP